MREILAQVALFVEQEIGWKSTSLSETIWLGAIEERMQKNGTSDPHQYWNLLSESQQEQKAFVELLVVPETWFFRHEASFKFLRYLVHEVWAKQTRRTEPLRILSVPSSTGEEPYSIVMALLEAGVPGAWFHVDAVDISERLIAAAKEGVYSDYAFRNQFEHHRENFFTKVKRGYQILDFVRQQVTFYQANIADPDFLKGYKPYDLIFCRNLFIYLKPEVLAQVKNTFDRLLVEEGLLIVSPVETQTVMGWGYASVGPSGASAFTPFCSSQKVAKEKPVASAVDENRLKKAHQLADAGEFDEAYALCSAYIAKENMDAEGHFLLGVIEHARGNAYNAERSFRKALYLAPTHKETLIYLALLAETRGDIDEAKQLKMRAKR